jgi:hypothetical protein
MLIVLIAMTFVSFGLGTYTVFSNPNSNVVSKTIPTQGGGVLLSVQGSSFYNNTVRAIWVDPQFSSSDSSLLKSSSGFRLGNVNIDSNGGFATNLTISSTILNEIKADGSNPHSVWVVGNASGNAATSQAGYIAITSDSQQNYTASSQGNGIYFFVTLFVFSLPFKFSFGGLFIVLWTIYLILFAVVLNGPFRNIIQSLKDATKKDGVGGLMSNSAFALFMVFPVALWGSILLALLQQTAGIPTGNLPPTDPLLEFLELSIAPLREEIGFRVIPIGVVALSILFSRGRIKDGIMALWHPSRYLKRNDTPSSYNRDRIIMFILIGISAGLFGAAHVLLGAGWDIGKVSQAAGVGVALGALYYEYGFAATVLLHWGFDYVVDSYTTNPIFLNWFIYYELYTAAVAIAATIALVVLLVRRLRRGPLIQLNSSGL